MPDKVGRYRVLGELGRGSMGTVYRAEDTLIGRVVALKTVNRPGPTSPPQEHEAYARFLREARAAGTFLHPNVVTVFDVGEDGQVGLSYIAMEMVQGESLDHTLRRRHAFDWDTIRRIGWQTASALKAAHEAGIVHRDIKPANLILTVGGDVKVADFGIAKIANAQMTQDGSLLGSPGYMSPEQVRASSVDHRSDLYSLGIVLYELVTLKPAFPGTNVFEVITAVANSKLKRPRDLRPDVPADLEAIILRATTKDRDKRFQSAAELMEALRPAPTGGPPAPHMTIISEARSSTGSGSIPLAPPGTSPTSPGTDPLPPGVASSAEHETTKALPDAASASAQMRALIANEEAREKGTAKVASAGGRRALWAGVAVLLVAGIAAALALRGGGNAGSSESASGDTPPPLAATSPLPSPEPSAAAATPASPAPTAPAMTTAVAASTPRRKATPKATATPAPAVPPPTVAATPVGPHWELRATHTHTTSVCRGTLRISDAGFDYDSEDKFDDDGKWGWEAIEKVKVGDGVIEIAIDEKTMGGLRSKRYRWRADNDDIPKDLELYLKAKKKS